MKAILICPADRPGVARLAERQPLAVVPLLGKSVLEYWIEALVARGVRHLAILANDRPNQVRAAVGDGARWGVRLDLVTQTRELSVAEARARYRRADDPDWLANEDVVLLDTLPALPGQPLFESYAGWFAALDAWMPHATSPARVGAREVSPGVWVGLHSQIDPRATLRAPCWIGGNVFVAAGATVGPHAVVDDRVIVEEGARISYSSVHPDTFVGRHVSIARSLACGSTLINWQTGSCLDVPDAFLLGPLESRRFDLAATGLAGGVLALAAMLVTSPLALAVMLVALLRGESPLRLRLGVRPRVDSRGAQDSFGYYELTGAGNWLRRWPQFWSVARGDLAWVGNRPLRPTQAFRLVNDFERLWLAGPPGLISLSDACGCPEGVSPESCAHASYYTVNASRRLDSAIVARALVRAAMAWPIYWTTRRERVSPLPGLASEREG